MKVEPNDVKIEMSDKRIKPFDISRKDIKEIFNYYQQRNASKDEFELLQKYGGENGIARQLKTSLETGLENVEPESLAHRVEDFGQNRFEEEPLKHCCMHVWEAFGDLFLQILIGAALVQIVLGATVSDDPSKDWIDGMSIVVAIIVVVSVGSITNYQKDKMFKGLSETIKDTIQFLVNRKIKYEIKPEDLLVGDIVELATGMIIPADGMVVYGTLKVDESTLTGETRNMEKRILADCLNFKEHMKSNADFEHMPSPMVYSGTNVVDGQGKFLVLAVGKYTVAGEIRENVKQSQEADDAKTPLEEKLEDIATQIGYFGLVAALVTLIALFIQFGVNYASKSANFNQSTQKNQLLAPFAVNFNNKTLLNSAQANLTNPSTQVSGSILNIFLLCVAIIVVAIPEGLPLAVTLTLAFSIGKMMKEKNLVRQLAACETMGGANFICTDKTGTLTRNIMSVNTIFDCKQNIDVAKATQDKSKKSSKEFFPNKNDYYNLLKLTVMLNIDVQYNEKEEIIKANKSDQSLIDLFDIFGENICRARKEYLNGAKLISFNSDRKRMSTFAKHKDFPSGHRLFLKGAPDILLNKAKFFTEPNSNVTKELSDEDRNRILETVDNFGGEALRTLAICYKDISAEEFENHTTCDESGLTIVAVCGIRDSLRPGVAEAVSTCTIAGITTVMVTGDSLQTAVAIAKQCHIIDQGVKTEGSDIAMLGEKFYTKIGGLECKTCHISYEECQCPRTKTQAEKIKDGEKKLQKVRVTNMEEFKKIASSIRVIARCRPLDKYALVVGLKDLDHVVAATGDGTNDAMALSKSDVGFSMGIQGTEIAKEASDIIILDDNFASMVTAVKWGRNVYDNIRKFIQFQLSVNLCACLLVFITACIGNETPLKPIQMLWLNLIMDSLGSLALATEPPHDAILLRKPCKRREKIINPRMWKHIILHAAFSLGLLIFLYLYAPYFIVEDAPTKIAEYQKLIGCYGLSNFPGQAPVTNLDGSTTYFIIQGSSSMWSANANVLPGCVDYSNYANLALAYKGYNSKFGATSHMTLVFNIFVIYTLFNQFNARVIDDSFNVFYNIHQNFYFIGVIGLELGLQVILIEFGSSAFKVSSGGITGSQWGICIGFGALTFIVAVIAKLIPLEIALEKCLKKEDDEEEEKKNEADDVSVNNDVKNLNVYKKDEADIAKKPSLKQMADDIVRRVSTRGANRKNSTINLK